MNYKNQPKETPILELPWIDLKMQMFIIRKEINDKIENLVKKVEAILKVNK